MTDPFEALREPVTSVDPDPEPGPARGGDPVDHDPAWGIQAVAGIGLDQHPFQQRALGRWPARGFLAAFRFLSGGVGLRLALRVGVSQDRVKFGCPVLDIGAYVGCSPGGDGEISQVYRDQASQAYWHRPIF